MVSTRKKWWNLLSNALKYRLIWWKIHAKAAKNSKTVVENLFSNGSIFLDRFYTIIVVFLYANLTDLLSLSFLIRTFLQMGNSIHFVHHIFVSCSCRATDCCTVHMTYSKAWWNFLENRMRWPENGKNYSLLQKYYMKAKTNSRQRKKKIQIIKHLAVLFGVYNSFSLSLLSFVL